MRENLMRRNWAVALLITIAATPAFASERHFTYTYESVVLHPGGREIEPWSTFRLGRESYFARLDTRLEAELGLTERLQTSLYLNLSSTTRDTDAGRVSSSEIEGISSEWKMKLSDPVADAAGFAVYGELSGGPGEVELEGKLIVDKRVGRWLAAANLSAESEWEFAEAGATERETKLELTAASCYFLKPGLTAGLELRSHTVLPPAGEPTRSALFLGPTLSYSREGWWVAASVLPQLTALTGASSGHRDLVEHEKLELRVLFGLGF
jgi:hypothetical protein